MANMEKFDRVFAPLTPKKLRPGVLMEKAGILPEQTKASSLETPGMTQTKTGVDNSKTAPRQMAPGMSLAESEEERARRRQTAGLSSVLSDAGRLGG